MISALNQMPCLQVIRVTTAVTCRRKVGLIAGR
jgi:hypothetical protein